jgi:hypothetical protein
VSVLGDVGVLFGHHLDAVDAEVRTHGQNGLLVVARGGGHPGHERVACLLVVALGDVGVGVVAGRAVALVERAVDDLREVDTRAHQIVLDDFGGGDDDARALPEVRAVVGTCLARVDDDLVVGDVECGPVELGVLGDEGLGRRQQQGLVDDLAGESLGGHEQADGRLPEAGRETDQGVSFQRGVGQSALVPAVL